MGFDARDAARIARAGFEAAWCDDDQRARLLADVDGAIRALTAALEPTVRR
jgi:adenosine deaminase